jgi:hypothetical protein
MAISLIFHTMAKIALLSDIHGNLQALKAVLQECGPLGVTRVACLGDVVGYGADSTACVRILRRIHAPMIMGNHEWATLLLKRGITTHLPSGWQSSGYGAGLQHSVNTLTEEDMAWLSSARSWLDLHDGLAGHATFIEPMTFPYVESLQEAMPSLGLLETMRLSVGFLGHTHQQAVFRSAKVEWIDRHRIRLSEKHPTIVMVGSVGQSRDREDLRASWAIYDTDHAIVELRKTPYDRIAAAQAILAAGLPAESAFRLLTDAEWQTLAHPS